MKNQIDNADSPLDFSERRHLNSTRQDSLKFLRSLETKLSPTSPKDKKSHSLSIGVKDFQFSKEEKVDEKANKIKAESKESSNKDEKNSSQKLSKEKNTEQLALIKSEENILQEPRTLAHVNSLPIFSQGENNSLAKPIKKNHTVILREVVLKKAEKLGDPDKEIQKFARTENKKESIFLKKVKRERSNQNINEGDFLSPSRGSSIDKANNNSNASSNVEITKKDSSDRFLEPDYDTPSPENSKNNEAENKYNIDSNPKANQNFTARDKDDIEEKEVQIKRLVPSSIASRIGNSEGIFKAKQLEQARKPIKKPSTFSNFWKNLTVKRINQIVPEGKRKSTEKRNWGFGSNNKLDVFRILGAVRKFKNLIKYKNYQNLSFNQLSIINDWAYFSEKKSTEPSSVRIKNKKRFPSEKKITNDRTYEEKIGGEAFSKCKDFSANTLKKIKLFNPKARWKMTWDLIIMILIFWNFMIISIAISFGRSFENVFLFSEFTSEREWYYVFLMISFVNFTIDKVLTVNTSYYEMGVYVSNRRRIFENYIKNYLIVDLIAEIPFLLQIFSYSVFINASVLKYLNCLFFLKYYNLKGVFKVLEEFLALDDKYEAFFSLMKLFVKIFFVAHLLACLWHSAAFFGRNEEDKTWLLKKGLCLDSFWTERYIYSVYFALTTMTTVGYGDISPENQREVLVAVLTMLVGSAMFGYSINSIGELLKKMNKKEDELKKKATLLDRYMKSKKIDYELQARARKYLEFVWNEENVETSDEILQKLSSNLREEVLLQSNGKFLLNYPMLCRNFSEKTMRKLIYHIKPVRYSPEETIFEEGEFSLDPVLYLIAHGEIELCLPLEKGMEDSCRLKILQEGKSFGEISFFTELPQTVTARSINYSTVYLLNKREFLNIISQNHDDWEKFCMIRDKIQLYQDYEDIQLKCYSCNEKHYIEKCPAVRYVPDKTKIILVHQNKLKKRKIQRRSLIKSRTKKKFNALLQNKEIRSKAQGNQDLTNDNSNNDSGRDLSFDNASQKEISSSNKKNENFSLKLADINQKDEKRQSFSINPLYKINQAGINQDSKRKSFEVSLGRTEEIRNVKEKTNPRPGPANQNESPTHKTIIEDKNNKELEHEEAGKLNNDNLSNNKEELFMMNFDYYKNFNKYFAHNNPDSVIIRMALKLKSRTKKGLSELFSSSKAIKNLIRKDSPLLELTSPKKMPKLSEFHDKLMKRQSTKRKFFNGD